MLWQRAWCAKEQHELNTHLGVLLQGDCFELDLSKWREQAQCIYLDPLSITGKTYRYRNRLEEGTVKINVYRDYSLKQLPEYLDYLRRLFTLAKDLLKDTGSLFIHADFHSALYVRQIADEVMGANKLVNDIIWHYQQTGQTKVHFPRRHDIIFYYGKGDKRYFRLSNVPSGKKRENPNHMRRRVDEKGRSYREIVSGGKRYVYYDDAPIYPDDVWDDIARQPQKDQRMTGYPGERPVALCERMLLSTTRPGDLFIDLSCGSGASLLAAAHNNRRFVGIDSSPIAFMCSRKRLQSFSLLAQADLSDMPVLVDCNSLPGIGYYDVELISYLLPKEETAGLGRMDGCKAVDQWCAGLLRGDTFHVFASAKRDEQTQSIERSLKVPLLKGTVAIMIIDILGNRTFWTASPLVY
ncbi:MAG TPA: site-specific DNA-methyltransferase [Clostridiales bacterium]|nr:site-specific DNA-methyltransferase [Clostridiales bacterium]